jgi:putative tricarboxylic transport membrane protein
MTKLKMLATTAALMLAGTTSAFATECIAPANAGGGWDFTCRQVGKLLYDLKLVDAPVQVTNMAGAGGGLAYAHVVADMNTDADVAKDSPFQNLGDMVAAIKADPGSVAFAGGSAAGGFDHMKPLQVMKSAGFSDITKVKYIGVDGGADAITQTIGGHTQAMTGDMSEIVGFIKSGDVRVLAVLTEARVPGFEDIPTAREQGFDVVAVNWRGLYVPKGISDDQFNAWATKLQAVADSAEWKETMTANGLAPFTKVGTDFQGWVDGVIAETETLSREIGVIQ